MLSSSGEGLGSGVFGEGEVPAGETLVFLLVDLFNMYGDIQFWFRKMTYEEKVC